jgi:hypothetical protein
LNYGTVLSAKVTPIDRFHKYWFYSLRPLR